jgi:hypothetical protein
MYCAWSHCHACLLVSSCVPVMRPRARTVLVHVSRVGGQAWQLQ